MRYFYSLLICFLFFHVQAQTVYGVVLSDTGEALDYANVFTTSYDRHTHTDEKGYFRLDNIHIGDTLLISHITSESLSVIITDVSIKKGILCRLKTKQINIQEIVIESETSALKTLSKLDLQVNPVQNSQEVLRMVPGLFIGQHAGGGKAEQIFLRGFDIDHGTDLSLAIDGMPVNMVSHAHGQGYADMHFIMPEVIEKISYGKGPYDTNKGNFATAGYVEFKTLDNPLQSFLTLEKASFGTNRTAGLIKILSQEKQSAYVASEFMTSDGPFDSTQGFTRFNGFAKYTYLTDNFDKLSISISRFSSKWDASGQIPERAILSGQIGRFGAIDNTEGGVTSRSNINLNFTKVLSPNQFLKTHAFMSSYDFLLFSNFTFFLNDPVNGDQIRQKEKRNLYGIESEYTYNTKISQSTDWILKIGGGWRYDDINDMSLSQTLNRKMVISTSASGDVDESNTYAYMESLLHFGKWTLNTGLRLDAFNFSYRDALSTLYTLKTANKTAISPKVNITYAYNRNLQLYFKSGRGFHSNDTRVVIDSTARQILPEALGTDVGLIVKPHANLMINAALWYLYLGQEFVYVGDGGIVEPGEKTVRKGIDIGIRYQIGEHLFIYSDANYAHARNIEQQEGANFIALAPVFTHTGGINYQSNKKWQAGLKYRHIADRPANEDISIVANGYTVADANFNLHFKSWSVGFELNNIFNTEWNETQFATESRLQNEPAYVEEIHFTPGFPRAFRAKLSWVF